MTGTLKIFHVVISVFKINNDELSSSFDRMLNHLLETTVTAFDQQSDPLLDVMVVLSHIVHIGATVRTSVHKLVDLRTVESTVSINIDHARNCA